MTNAAYETIIGCDDGRSGTKADNGRKWFACAPIVARGGKKKTEAYYEEHHGGRVGRIVPIVYKNCEWLIGEDAHYHGVQGSVSMDLDKANKTALIKILTAVAELSPRAPLRQTVGVCVGIPAGRFEQDRDRLVELLKGEHVVLHGERERTFHLQGRVVPEGFGILMRAAMDGNHAIDMDLIRGTCVVIDIGHRTVNLLVVRGLTDHYEGQTLHHGGADLCKTVFRKEVEQRMDTILEEVERQRLISKLLWDGVIPIRGESLTKAYFLECLAAQSTEIWPTIETAINDMLVGLTYDFVIVGGGAAQSFQSQLEKRFGMKELRQVTHRFAQAEGYRLLVQHAEALQV